MKMREIFYDYQEFIKKVAPGSGAPHCDGARIPADSTGISQKVTLSITALERVADREMIAEFVVSEIVDGQDDARMKDLVEKSSDNVFEDLQMACRVLYKRLEDKYAKPIGATPGKWVE